MAYSINAKDYFNTKLYSGTGSSNAITGVGFQPDLTWIKARSHTYAHCLIDAVRAVGTTIASNSSSAAYSSATEITSFNTDGFTLGTDNGVNNGSHTFVSWNWKANGAGSANTDGTINTTATSVNTTSGFSISKYVGNGTGGATIGHGLGKVPKWIIIKKTSGTEQWVIGESASGFTKNLHFTTGTTNTSSSVWNDTAPTSSVFSVGTNSGTNSSGQTYIAYCWSEIIGFSKMGKYIGNASTNGPMVFCGFKPAYVLIKNVSATNNWFLQDCERIGYNFANHLQKPNTDGADDTGSHLDILSNGFKVRSSSANNNGSGNTMVYIAFAKAPLVGTNNIPATAR